MKTGIVDVGGGIRGIYAAGVFDFCLDRDIHFDLSIGVSAGSANVVSYLAGQRGRNYKFYTEYALRKEYMGARNVLKQGSYIDLNYVYGTLSNSGGEYPLDYQAIMDNPGEMLVVATNAMNGSGRYFKKSELVRDHYDMFKASSAIPFICRPYTINWTPYFDGALADPVPVEKAFQCGCDKVVVLLTRPADRERGPGKDAFFADRIQHRYPFAARKLRTRVERYNEGVTLAKKYQEAGKALIIAPNDTCGVDTLTRDKAAMMRLYRKGYQDAQAIQTFLYGEAEA
ncbi:MAG: patatin family protein [Oscillospiraceae bacterium]|nr:patatin family protein [Oscillospiraceae bacterium]